MAGTSRLINKPTITSVSNDTVFYTDSATNGVNGIKVENLPVVHLSGAETITGGKAFAKGAAFYGNDLSDLPTTVGAYVAAYYSSTYSTTRLLGYNGSTYQSLALGAMPTAGTFALKLNTDGTATFGYGINIEARHYVGQPNEPVYQNGWVKCWADISFYKDNFGLIHIDGSIQNPNSPTFGQTIFTLPSNYAPKSQFLISAGSINAGGAADIFITTDGQVRYAFGWDGSSSVIGLDGISFRP